MGALRTLIATAVLAPLVSAQAVTVTLTAGTLSLKGSAGVDKLTITAQMNLADGDAVPLDIIVTPNDDTTVNGSSSAALFEDVIAIKIALRGGDDELELEDISAAAMPLAVSAGSGNDDVTLNGADFGTVKFVGGAGHDVFNVLNSAVGVTKATDTSGNAIVNVLTSTFDALTVTTGPLADLILITGATVTTDLLLSFGAGDDSFLISELEVGSETSFKLGPGNDSLNVSDSTQGASVAVVAASGDDVVVFTDSIVGAALDVRLGSGVNVLALASEDTPLQVGGSVTVTGSADKDSISVLQDTREGSISIAQDLVLALKSGENELEQTGDVVIGRDLLVTTGALADQLAFDGLSVSHDASFLLGAGTNTLVLNDCLIGNDLTITTGKDDDTLQLSGSTNVGGTQSLDLGGGET